MRRSESDDKIEWRVVDNRVFLLGLDGLYRDLIKEHERGELLECARRIAGALDAGPADVPIEGYYAEDEQLTEYFRLVRTLQDIYENRRDEVSSLPEFIRLQEVTSSPIFGKPAPTSGLLPAGRDPLSQALLDSFPAWTVDHLVTAACDTALKTDDFSLVGLAARIKDAVVLAAVRESVVLYAEMAAGAAMYAPEPRYVWKVDSELADQSRRFIGTFNSLFDEQLPPPEPAQAARYWVAYCDNDILGRCVRLGYDDSTLPVRYYHWGIYRVAEGEFAVEDFWKTEVWTTSLYRSSLHRRGRGQDD
ncbi:MAG TPA: hypothetical protein VFV34_18870 [Blastocatellia bacterium]|nr:hypothetical protein [Blastocatellia bacterium]